MRLRSSIFIAVMLVTPFSRAQPATQPMLGANFQPAATRADLADSYLRLERTLRDHPPAADDLPRVSRAYDTAALHFFSGKSAEAIRTMNELADSLLPAQQRTQASRVVHAIKVRVAPQVAMRSRPSALHVKFSPLYPVKLEAPLSLKLVFRSDQRIVLEQAVELRADAALPNFTLRQPDALIGSYRVQLIAADGEIFEMTRWFVTETPLDVQRAVNDRALLRVNAREPKILQAMIACRMRNALLGDNPGEAESARFGADLIALSKELAGEIDSLLAGKDPYVNRAGDYWRAIPAKLMQVPARIYAPEAALTKQIPLPLVIVLHGAGGDENAFMDGYGAGAIKRLADQHGFIVVAPSTYWCTPNPEAFSSILEALSFDYSIDRNRIYVLGHSLGAMAAANMASKNSDQIAGACLLAGGDFYGMSKICPTLLIAGGLDPVIPAKKLDAAAQKAQAARLPVEFEMMENYGHVNMAADALPRAVEWLLAHRREQK